MATPGVAAHDTKATLALPQACPLLARCCWSRQSASHLHSLPPAISLIHVWPHRLRLASAHSALQAAQAGVASAGAAVRGKQLAAAGAAGRRCLHGPAAQCRGSPRHATPCPPCITLWLTCCCMATTSGCFCCMKLAANQARAASCSSTGPQGSAPLQQQACCPVARQQPLHILPSNWPRLLQPTTPAPAPAAQPLPQPSGL
jgi:hypothetical protein